MSDMVERVAHALHRVEQSYGVKSAWGELSIGEIIRYSELASAAVASIVYDKLLTELVYREVDKLMKEKPNEQDSA